MAFLLDTNVFLFAGTAPERLNRQSQRLLADRSSILFLSTATAWEIVIKHSLGRLGLPDPPARWLIDSSRILGMQTLDITLAHAFAVADLPPLHRDPFDRMLIAQANAENLTLLTTDRIFQSYPGEVVLCGA
jgi:PIN domain nuclease of toxin-antitoxin system